MSRLLLSSLLVTAALFAMPACSSEDAQTVTETGGAGGTGGSASGGGGTGGSGMSGCAPGTTTQSDGSCSPAGVPPDACGDGFDATDGGCTAILPDEPCGDGLIAVPGDTACREIAPCGAAPWGDIPIEANTQFVDVTYAGGDSDGTEAKPWTTIQEAIDAADPDAVVALAAGSYVEHVTIAASAVRLIGRCPAMVELSTDAVANGALVIDSGASGTEARGFSITGTDIGAHVLGATDVTLEDLWLHDLDDWGIWIETAGNPTSVAVRNVLVERALDDGILVLSAEVTAEGVAIRDTRRQLGMAAAGVNVQEWDPIYRGSLTLQQSLVTQSNGAGAYVGGADLILDRSLILDSRVALGTVSGVGVTLQDGPEHTQHGSLTMRQSVIEMSRTLGVYISGGDAILEDSTIRDVTLDPSATRIGHGIGIEDHILSARPSTVQIDRCLIDQATETAMSIYGSDVTINATRIRDTALNPKIEWFGRGVNIQNGAQDPSIRSTVHITDSVIERNFDVGVMTTRSDLWLEHSAITDTMPMPEKGFGDGVLVLGGETVAEVTDCWIARSGRAGVSMFGGALTLRGNTIECNPIAIGTEVYEGGEPALVDDGGNVCTCDGLTETCRAQQSSLEPPQAL